MILIASRPQRLQPRYLASDHLGAEGDRSYCSTSSAMRWESAWLRSTGTNSPAANSRTNAISARAANSGLKHLADLCRHSGRHDKFLGCRAEQLGAPRWSGSLTAPAGTRGPESTKITGRAQTARSLQCVCQVGFVTHEAANEGFPRRNSVSCSAFRLFLSAAAGQWPRFIAVAPGSCG